MTVVLTYHDLSEDRSPLCVPPALFSEHLSVIAASGAKVLTVSELAQALRDDRLPERAVVLTFDDGLAGAVREARPRLAAAGMRGTFFCVAGHLGGVSDWPSRQAGAPVRPLAAARELADLAGDGNELGSHGWTHAPLDGEADLRREIVESREALAAETGAEIRSFAYPYGAPPTDAARTTRRADVLCRLRARRPPSDSRLVALRRSRGSTRTTSATRACCAAVVSGSLDAYLGARRIGSRTRRALRKDYATEAVR